jgi:nucleotide-binding universal stress UspA family protein
METIMLPIGSVLCAVDFSEQSRHALRWASAITHSRRAEMTVLSVVDPLLAGAAAIRLRVDLARDEAEPALRKFVEATVPEHQRQAAHVRMEVKVGNSSEVILETGRRQNAALIVMGTHGRRGFRKLLLGSTTEQVLRRTEVPVLAVPGGAVPAPAATDPGVQLKKILLATDFRESALAATQWATELASDINIPVVFAHVVEPVVVPARWLALAAEFESERVASGRRMLGQLADSIHHANHECVVSIGRPADAIAALATEYGAGLVVMGLANPDNSERPAPGSIAYRVLRLGHVAVVVVPGSQSFALSQVPASLGPSVHARQH